MPLALTLRQPWASLVMLGIKRVENRRWPTTHRGELYIHAGLTIEQNAMQVHRTALPDVELPRGMLLGTVQVVDCQRGVTDEWAEPGYWHWIFADPQPLPEPVKCRGNHGLWAVPPYALR